MKLQDAIRINTNLLSEQQGRGLSYRIDALKLGIEALKDKIKARTHGHAYSHRLLPGETKE